jgi:hypothetical protein
MSTITATIDLKEDVSDFVMSLFHTFPIGARLKVEISEVEALPLRAPSLEEYRKILSAAREQLPCVPWKTTAETMKMLREGEDH